MSGVVASCAAIARVQPFTLTLSSYYFAPNIRNLAIAAGWNASAPLIVSITATTGGAINVPSAASASFPGGLTLQIAAGARVLGAQVGPGSSRGGTAIKVAQAITIDNLGSIIGGGGPGGYGGNATAGGQTASGGAGGSGAGVSAGGYASWTSGTAGQTKTDTGFPPAWEIKGGTGGRGGVEGAQGEAGSSGVIISGTGTAYPGNAGMPAGYAVEGNSYITWINTGTRAGGVV
ncbi:hypothetical protein [Comamonas flocculans]|uniref:Collagen-like protein n=1 Tax=Comamonas flocculans TaxID=2597701 RepID=A0A5B8RXM8_9BURK|nr:hypothetical protein [Comamonas flocculans]QEA14281.1 hypothetical protein FOZ74_15270 [Comamonas flocculans]